MLSVNGALPSNRSIFSDSVPSSCIHHTFSIRSRVFDSMCSTNRCSATTREGDVVSTTRSYIRTKCWF